MEGAFDRNLFLFHVSFVEKSSIVLCPQHSNQKQHEAEHEDGSVDVVEVALILHKHIQRPSEVEMVCGDPPSP